jgi:hypothetical protein
LLQINANLSFELSDIRSSKFIVTTAKKPPDYFVHFLDCAPFVDGVGVDDD